VVVTKLSRFFLGGKGVKTKAAQKKSVITIINRLTLIVSLDLE